MRLHRVLIVSIAVLTLSGVVSTQGSGGAEARLRAAMDKETVDGDLKAAADSYKQVISDRGANRAVVAQALLRLGMAYEKQGSKDANASYERIVRDFGDQPTLVQLAKARMSVAAVSAGPTLRQVCSWECDGEISPDGRKILLSRNGGLALSELGSTGSGRQVVPAPSSGVVRGHFSPDGRRIVYTVRPAQGASNGDIFVVDADGRNARTVYHGAFAEGWSADGRRILATVADPVPREALSPIARLKADLNVGLARPTKLLWVTVADGAVQPIPTSAWENMDVFAPSPDGRYIAFSGNRDEATRENVFVIASDGSSETRISPAPLYQEPVGWSPDGKYLLYSQSGDATSLWAVPMANGRPQGPAVSIRQFQGRVSFRGITRSGTLHYRVLSNSGEPYTASMDPTSGKVTSVPAVVPTPTPGGPMAWSSDSSRIAYLTGSALQGRELHVFSFADGKDQRVPAKVSFVNSLCWPRGGESVLANTSANGGFESVRVDLTTGETRPLFPGAPSFRLWNCTDTTAANFDPLAVKVRNIATGAETELYRLKRPANNYGMSKISPDGRLVAFLESIDADTSVLLTVPSSGGAARELARVKAPAQLQQIDGHAWSPDTRYVYFFKRANSQAPHRLYRVPVAGGAEESMGLDGMELRGLEIAPDGRKLFFVVGAFNRPEIWALENFLPAGK